MGGNIQYNPGWHLALDLKNMIDISEAVTRAALSAPKAAAHTPARTSRIPTRNGADAT